MLLQCLNECKYTSTLSLSLFSLFAVLVCKLVVSLSDLEPTPVISGAEGLISLLSLLHGNEVPTAAVRCAHWSENDQLAAHYHVRKYRPTAQPSLDLCCKDRDGEREMGRERVGG